MDRLPRAMLTIKFFKEVRCVRKQQLSNIISNNSNIKCNDRYCNHLQQQQQQRQQQHLRYYTNELINNFDTNNNNNNSNNNNNNSLNNNNDGIKIKKTINQNNINNKNINNYNNNNSSNFIHPFRNFHSFTMNVNMSATRSTTNEHSAPALNICTTSNRCGKVLTMETLNPHIANIEYAVRGPIVIRAAEIENELKKGVPKPFKQVIRANIGDCHACGQKPLTFLRQVVALCTYPELMDNPNFNHDAKQRAQRILDGCRGHSIGSYSDSVGIDVIRHDIAQYITDRDGGIPSNPDDIFLSTGASEGIKAIMKLLVTGRDNPIAGIMLPVPVYPLYTALLAEFNTYPILYYLNEENNWSLETEELERALNEAKPHCIPRALVVINPGNPTGQVLKQENIRKIIEFAKRENIFLLADEVYQHNIYGQGAEFHSFKKTMKTMGPEYEKMELASFMSTSKGYMGECGYRGGYCELINMDPDVKYHLLKSLSAKLCPSVTGQAAMGVVVNPPKPGEPSYKLFITEKEKVLGELKMKAQLTSQLLNEIDGITCNEVEGAMYAFPRIWLPVKAIEAAKIKNVEPDAMYCTELLEATGICVVPGSGFGQKPGTYHFRMTILPTVQELQELLRLFAEFHKSFMEKYG